MINHNHYNQAFYDSDEDDSNECPLCTEEFDVTDKSFRPCKCGYQICVWCWHKIMEDSKRCPNCRRNYDSDNLDFTPPDPELYVFSIYDDMMIWWCLCDGVDLFIWFMENKIDFTVETTTTTTDTWQQFFFCIFDEINIVSKRKRTRRRKNASHTRENNYRTWESFNEI